MKPMNPIEPYLGLATTNRPTMIPPGACQSGSKNFSVYGKRLRKMKGYKRLTGTRPDTYAHKLSGQYFRGKITSATSGVAFIANAQTFEIIFRVDRLNETQTLLYKGNGEAAGTLSSGTNFDWSVSIDMGGVVRVRRTRVFLSDTISYDISADGDGLPVLPGNWYALAVVIDSTAAVGSRTQLYLQRIGSSNQGSVTSTLEASGYLSTATDIYFGACPLDVEATTSQPFSLSKDRESLVQYPFQGVIQEIRFWDDVRTPTEIKDNHALEIPAGSANLTGLWRLTGAGTNRYFFNPTTGTQGGGSGQFSRLELEPRDATWISSGHVLGNPVTGYSYSLGLNGRNNGVVVPNSYLYRKQDVNTDGELESPDNFYVSTRLRVGTRKNRACVWHWTHVPDYDFGNIIARKGTARTTSGDAVLGATTGVVAQSALAVDNSINRAAGSYVTDGFEAGERILVTGFATNSTSFYATIVSVAALKLVITNSAQDGLTLVNEAAGGNETVISAPAFSAYLETVDVGAGVYEFAAVCAYETAVPSYRAATVVSNTGGLADNTEYDVTVTVDSDNSFIRIEVGSAVSVTQNFSVTSTGLRATPNEPDGSHRKYAFNIGNAVYRVRKLYGRDGDPNFFDIEYDYTKSFDGVIGHMVVGTASTLASLFSTFTPHDTFRSITSVTRAITTSSSGQVLSAWTFSEGAGNSIEDLGLTHNNLVFVNDSDHRWSKSGIPTAAKVRIRGGFDHRYATATGNVSKRVVVAGGSVYEVNLTTGALTWMTDGFRNDEDNIVTAMRFQDSLVLCAGGSNGNFHLWKDHLWSLDIKPPVGDIAWGIQDQKEESARLVPGTDKAIYQYAFTYENQAIQGGKVSPVVLVLTVIVRVKCNVAFGTVAEINQTYATIETFEGSAASRGIEPYGVTSGAGGKYVNVRSYLSTDTAPDDKRAYLAYATFTGHPFIEVCDDASAEEYAAAFQAACDKIFVDVLPDTRLRFNSKYIGSGARLRLNDGTTSFVTNDINDAGAATEGPISGTGVTGHGIALPKSLDQQVTHLTIWRTTANGQQFRRLVSLPNGTTSFVDNIPDADLVGEILDINAGPPPEAKQVVDLGGSAFFSGITNAPARIYVSEPGQPWNVRPQNVVDVFEGGAQPITGIARGEGALTLFKQDVSIVVTPTGDADLPLRFQTRSLERGCVSPFGVANIDDVFVFASERGLCRYDFNRFYPLSDVIQPTWDAIDEDSYTKVVCVFDRENDQVLTFHASGASSYNGSIINDQCLVWNQQVGAGPDRMVYGWSLLTGLYVEHAFVMPDANENNKVYIIEPTGFLGEWDSGENYGVGTLTSRTPASAAGTFSTTQFTLAQATLGSLPEGYLGLTVTVVDATDGTRETRMCVSDTLASPSVIALDHALSFTPELADTALIGSIEFDWIGAELQPAGPLMMTPKCTHVHLRCTPLGTAGTLTLAWKFMYGVQGNSLGTAATYTETSISVALNKSYVFREVTKGTDGVSHYWRLKQQAPDVPAEILSITPVFEDTNPRRGGYLEE